MILRCLGIFFFAATHLVAKDYFVYKHTNGEYRKIDLKSLTYEYKRDDWLKRKLHAVEGNAWILHFGADFVNYSKSIERLSYFTVGLSEDQKDSVSMVSDATHLPVFDRFFEISIITDVLNYSLDPKAVLKEIYRVTNNGGKLFFSTRREPEDKALISMFGKKYLEHLLKEVGWEIVEIRPLGGDCAVLAKDYLDLFEEKLPMIKSMFPASKLVFFKDIFDETLPRLLYQIDQSIGSSRYTGGYLIECKKP